MNCDCITDLENRLAAKYQDELKTPVDARCLAVSIGINDLDIVSILKVDFRLTAQAKGFVKGKTLPVIAKYCPFCGKSVEKGAALGGERKEAQ